MSDNLQIEVHPDYVLFKRSGSATYDEIVASWKQVALTCKELGIKKVLAHTINQSHLTITNIFQIASNFQELGFDLGEFKVAHVFTGTEFEEWNHYSEPTRVRAASTSPCRKALRVPR